tara:strand:+ start:725 stop:1639 length:915 start_codon:yes stop_codon:yes gene_type:complete
MITKIKDYIKDLSPLNLLIVIFVIGLVYGAINLGMKYQSYMKFLNRTQITVVKASPVIIDTAENKFRTLSTIKSLQSIDITSKVNGVIHNIHFIEGSEISKNQKLYSILSSDKVGMIEIYAPFSGLIGLSKKNVGDAVSKGTFLSSLDNNSKMKLELNLPERLAPFLKKDIQIRVISDNLANKKFIAKLDFIDTRIDKSTRTIAAYSLIDNENNLLKPGLLMKVDLILERINNAILIPEEALLSIDGEHYVYVVNNDKAVIKDITIGVRSDALIQVTSGLNEKDMIVYMGQEKLKDQSLIKIVD